jgi:predicted dehydrogenase
MPDGVRRDDAPPQLPYQPFRPDWRRFLHTLARLPEVTQLWLRQIYDRQNSAPHAPRSTPDNLPDNLHDRREDCRGKQGASETPFSPRQSSRPSFGVGKIVGVDRRALTPLFHPDNLHGCRGRWRTTIFGMSDAPIRWGILGTGGIATVFTEDLLLLPGHQVAAVGSRSPEKAQAFADRHGIPRAHGSYAALAADDEVDVVYVATPHSGHGEAARLCLEGGKGVLVEKPFTPTAAEAASVIALAKERGLFAMEAMWTRLNPLIVQLRQLVADRAIGEVQAVYADFSTVFDYDPTHRAWNPDLAGGALLDLGIYPLSFASMLLGPPDSVSAVAAKAPTGVDANTGILLGYPGGAVATLHCGFLAESPHTATVVGTTGRIEVDAPFYRPTSMTVHSDGESPVTITRDLPGHGYTFQAEEVARCLREGRTESPVMPLAETLEILTTMDQLIELIQ